MDKGVWEFETHLVSSSIFKSHYKLKNLVIYWFNLPRIWAGKFSEVEKMALFWTKTRIDEFCVPLLSFHENVLSHARKSYAIKMGV